MPKRWSSRTLVFGASGQIGSACATALDAAGHEVVRLARHGDPDAGIDEFDPFDETASLPGGQFNAVLWAQGVNATDSVLSFDRRLHLDLYHANALFVVDSLARLLAEERLVDGARLCVISSVWQTVGRQAKLSYMMSKAALQGLVLSASIDLAKRGILINAVLPGALNTQMTQMNLTAGQIQSLEAATPFGRLAEMDDVAATVTFLCSASNRSITGQFIGVDLGFRHARLV